MALTEKEKQRVSEEEAYRSKIREESQYRNQISSQTNKKGSNGCLIAILLIFALPILLAMTLIVINPAKQFEEAERKTEEAILSEVTPFPATKETKILQEQKAIAENLTKTALDLIANDRVQDAMNLYNDRWNELTKLRGQILFDKELTDAQKKNIDTALKGEQESITNILSKYQQVYE